jgi:hypothetical protein
MYKKNPLRHIHGRGFTFNGVFNNVVITYSITCFSSDYKKNNLRPPTKVSKSQLDNIVHSLSTIEISVGTNSRQAIVGIIYHMSYATSNIKFRN